MGQIVLQLPETLQKELENKANREGVELSQYILYTLTQQVNTGYIVRVLPPEDVTEQRRQFDALLESWGEAATDEEIDIALASREIAKPEPDLTPDLMAKVRARIAEARQQNQAKAVVKESI